MYHGRYCTLDNCTVTDTIIEERKNSKRDRYEVVVNGGTFKNTTFKNLMGTGNADSSQANYEFGIWLSNSISLENCVFQRCAINALDKASWNKCSILSSITYTNGQTTFEKCNFENCKTKAGSLAEINFNNCNIVNSGTFGNCLKVLNESYLLTDYSIMQANFKVGSTCNNSTICATGLIYQTSFYNIKFMNNSKIILEKYQHNKDIINSYSTEGVDYTVEYKGTDLL